MSNSKEAKSSGEHSTSIEVVESVKDILAIEKPKRAESRMAINKTISNTVGLAVFAVLCIIEIVLSIVTTALNAQYYIAVNLSLDQPWQVLSWIVCPGWLIISTILFIALIVERPSRKFVAPGLFYVLGGGLYFILAVKVASSLHYLGYNQINSFTIITNNFFNNNLFGANYFYNAAVGFTVASFILSFVFLFHAVAVGVFAFKKKRVVET